MNYFREAVKVIEQYGWTQHSWGNQNEGFCGEGAIQQAYRSRSSRANKPELHELLMFCNEYMFMQTSMSMPEFNDSRMLNGKAQVIAMLNHIADAWDRAHPEEDAVEQEFYGEVVPQVMLEEVKTLHKRVDQLAAALNKFKNKAFV